MSGKETLSPYSKAQAEHTFGAPLPPLELGVDYYPEQCSPEQWPWDISEIARAGLQWIRIADFAWGKLEPSPGQFDFAWLDRVLDLAAANSLRVLMCTPTAGPPTWLMRKHPEIIPIPPTGQPIRLGDIGGGLHLCPHQPAFLEAVERIVIALAQRYGQHPAVGGWQIDNEYEWKEGSEATCYCSATQQAFRAWLRSRWPDLHHLNQAWQTIAYAQPYSDWQDIAPPWPPFAGQNPALVLEWQRFRSHAQIEFLARQAKILRSHSPGRWLTHNLARTDQLDCHALAKVLDCLGWDSYPLGCGALHYSPARLAFQYQFIHAAGNRAFLLPEFQVGDAYFGRALRPGELTKLAAQARARGAFLLFYFQWRTPPASHEHDWQGILDPGEHNSRRLQEIRSLRQKLPALLFSDKVSLPPPAAGIVFHYDHPWCFSAEQQWTGDSPWAEAQAVYEAYWQAGLPVRIVLQPTDLQNLPYIWLPGLAIVHQPWREALRTALEGGATLLASARTGIKDDFGALLPVQETLAWQLFGVTPSERDRVQGQMTMQATPDCFPPLANAPLPLHRWLEALSPLTSETRLLARHNSGWLAGQPAMTSLAVGKGQAIYVGTAWSTSLVQRLLCALTAHEPLPQGVESIPLFEGEYPHRLLINHRPEPLTALGCSLRGDEVRLLADSAPHL